MSALPTLRCDKFTDPGRLFSGTIVIAAPHMDDEVLACGGTIARLPDPSRVHLIYATDGARSSTPVIPWRDKTSSDLQAVRRAEAETALGVLGVAPDHLHFLGFPDGKLKAHREAFASAFTELVRRLRPDQVLIPFRYDRHSDHLTVNRAVLGALGHEESRAEVFEYFVYYRWRLLPGRDIRRYIRQDHLSAVDIAPAAVRKRAALDCFTSQTTRFYRWQDRPVLSQLSLDEVCRQPELFLRYDPAVRGSGVFTGARRWIPLVHRVEPAAKRRKDQVMALVRRGMRWNVR